jgi:hypothetical protein
LNLEEKDEEDDEEEEEEEEEEEDNSIYNYGCFVGFSLFGRTFRFFKIRNYFRE